MHRESRSKHVWRWLAFMAVCSGVVVVMPACGSGLSDEEATQRCGDEEAAKGPCWGDASTSACKACYLECGDDCEAQALCPEEYACPAE